MISSLQSRLLLCTDTRELQRYEVLGSCACRYQLYIRREGWLMVQVQTKRKIDVMDALFLAPSYGYCHQLIEYGDLDIKALRRGERTSLL